MRGRESERVIKKKEVRNDNIQYRFNKCNLQEYKQKYRKNIKYAVLLCVSPAWGRIVNQEANRYFAI